MRLILLGLLLVIPPATQPASVSGDVRDPRGAMVVGAAVTLSAPMTPSKTVLTDDRGRFAFADVPPATYELSTSMPGFGSTRNRVQISADQIVTTTIQLPMGSLAQTINVIAPRRRAAVAGTITGTERPATASVEPAPAGPALPPPTGVIRVGGHVREPRRIGELKPPVYPADALAAGIEGIVIIDATISVDGSLIDARVLRGVLGLDAAALDAVRGWRYTPAMLNGAPVPVRTTVTIGFRQQ